MDKFNNIPTLSEEEAAEIEAAMREEEKYWEETAELERLGEEELYSLDREDEWYEQMEAIENTEPFDPEEDE